MQIKGAVNFEQKIYMFIVTVATRLLNCSPVSYFRLAAYTNRSTQQQSRANN
jgi:hypothetical protein